MSTIDSKAIITELLRADGRFGDDPQALVILTYINDWGKRTAAVCYFPEEVAGYCISEHIHNPELLWTRGDGPTILGQAWIDEWIDEWMEESKRLDEPLESGSSQDRTKRDTNLQPQTAPELK